jgi:hypothetical protein
VDGALIEDGEAEGLLRELEAAHAPGAGDRAAAEAPFSDDDGAGSLAPLARAVGTFDLDEFERDVLLLGLAAEIDGRYGRLIAYLNDHATRLRPTVGLAAALFGRAHRVDALASFLPLGPLVHLGLVETEGDGPLAGKAFRLSESFWPRLIEQETELDFVRLGAGPRAVDGLVLPPEVRERALACARWMGAAGRGGRSLLVVRGAAGSGRESLACAIAGQLGLPSLVVAAETLEQTARHPELRREVRWHGAALVVAASSSGATAPSPAAVALVRSLDAPVFWVATDGATEALAGESGRETLEIQLGEPSFETRLSLWERLLPAAQRAPDLDLAGVASRFRFGPGRIEAAVALAEARRRALGADQPLALAILDDVCATLPAARLSALAQRLPCPFSREDLVVPPETLRELDLAAAWARHRGRVFVGWGAGRKMVSGRGLACLFCGPPGTGKTMGAQVLAREVGLELYRIDLAQVVSKYIGETEKNLSKLFDEAYASNAILFFDEADALFGKRSEVKDAHDRYANIETAFLLQRIEMHDGITILATNLRRNMDDAFLRRLQVVAEFPVPGERERRMIWERHLPAGRGADLDLDLVARRFAVSGGEIRNAVVAAAFLGAAEGQPLGMRHLVTGLWREMRKGGRMIDPSEFGPWAATVVALSSADQTVR